MWFCRVELTERWERNAIVPKVIVSKSDSPVDGTHQVVQPKGSVVLDNEEVSI